MRARVPATVLVATLSLTACDAATERIAEEAVEAAVPGDTEIDLDGDSVTVETEDGEVTMDAGEDGDVTVTSEDGTFEVDAGGDAELPDGFPADIPLPADFTVQGATSFEDDSGRAFTVTLDAPTTDVASFVEDEAVPGLESAGYTILGQTTSTSGDSRFSNVQAENDVHTVNIGAQEQDGTVFVTVQVLPLG